MVNALVAAGDRTRYSSKSDITGAVFTLSDHLLPEDSPFHHWEIQGGYKLSVARRLLREIERRPVIATVVCLPSFEPEWAIRIHGSDKLGFAATLTKAQKQIYSAGQDAEVDVSQDDVILSSNLADELLEIWARMLRDAKYRASASAGLDGVSYHFLCYKNTHGHLCGRTCSPDPETTAGHFASLAHCLHDFVMVDSSNRPRVESQLEAEMNGSAIFPYGHHYARTPPLPWKGQSNNP